MRACDCWRESDQSVIRAKGMNENYSGLYFITLNSHLGKIIKFTDRRDSQMVNLHSMNFGGNFFVDLEEFHGHYILHYNSY